MKRLIAILLTLSIIFAFAGCKGGKNTENGEASSSAQDASGSDTASDDSQYTTQAAAYKSEGKSSGKSFETILDTNEYAMYYNIFYNKQGSDYADKPVIKKGIFSTLYDGYNKRYRYYVWGYNDQTKCCDWQWELKVEDESDLPANGSTVEVMGTLKESVAPEAEAGKPHPDYSLDGYWIEEPQITVKKEFKGPSVDVDMSTMSATLERVEAYYIANKDEKLEGQTVCMYGRVLSPTAIQHPYYDGAFEIGLETDDEMPAIGIMVMVTGTIKDGKIVNATVSQTEDY